MLYIRYYELILLLGIDLKLKTEYLHEKQGILISEKALQREMLVIMGETIKPKI